MAPEPIDLGIEDLADAVEVGAGGFGTVYKARQESLRRDVAVKMVTSTVKDRKVRIRFEREIQSEAIFGETFAPLSLVIVLHLGTLIATLLVFRADVARLLTSTARGLKEPRAFLASDEGRLVSAIVVGSAPDGFQRCTAKINEFLRGLSSNTASVGVLDKIPPSQ